MADFIRMNANSNWNIVGLIPNRMNKIEIALKNKKELEMPKHMQGHRMDI